MYPPLYIECVPVARYANDDNGALCPKVAIHTPARTRGSASIHRSVRSGQGVSNVRSVRGISGRRAIFQIHGGITLRCHRLVEVEVRVVEGLAAVVAVNFFGDAALRASPVYDD